MEVSGVMCTGTIVQEEERIYGAENFEVRSTKSETNSNYRNRECSKRESVSNFLSAHLVNTESLRVLATRCRSCAGRFVFIRIGYGRGAGMGRDLGVGADLGVGVGVGEGEEDAVDVGVAVGVSVGVAVGV